MSFFCAHVLKCVCILFPLNSYCRRREPCDGCVAPYGFRNHMALNADSDIFTDKVKATNISGNLDAPEGGFDAIMQAIVCTNEIGWRRDSRKLVVFSTDSGFHYAGDGKVSFDHTQSLKLFE